MPYFSFIVKAPKKNPGEHFEGLNLLSELLKPQGASNIRQTQNIEVVDSNDVDDGDAGGRRPDGDYGDAWRQWQRPLFCAIMMTATARQTRERISVCVNGCRSLR